jgi:hypothetical protein
MMTNIFKCGREDGKPLVSGNGKTPTQPVRLTGFLRWRQITVYLQWMSSLAWVKVRLAGHPTRAQPTAGEIVPVVGHGMLHQDPTWVTSRVADFLQALTAER